MKITKLQKEILLHRLEATDAIADCLSDDDILPYDEAFEAAESVWNRVKTSDWRDMSPAELLVLCEAVAGSTWCGSIDEYETPQVAGRHIAAGERLAEAVANFTGLPCTFPGF